jgi:hypothetical protein
MVHKASVRRRPVFPSLLAVAGLVAGGAAGWLISYYAIDALIRSDPPEYWALGYLMIHATSISACAGSAFGLIGGCVLASKLESRGASLGEDTP